MAKRKSGTASMSRKNNNSSSELPRTPVVKAAAKPVVKSVATKPPAPRSSKPKSAPTTEQIAVRAYEIWVAKGRPQGIDDVNWRQAERELSAAS